jgi:hypothetical protein
MDRWQLQLDSATRNSEHVVDRLVHQLAHDADVERFGDRFYHVLEQLHADATVYGRSRAGDLAPPDIDDRRFAEVVLKGEEFYLAKFLDDLDLGRYVGEDGDLSERAVAARARMYLTKAKATANEAWALTDGGPFTWVLGEAEHCGDCLDLAARSPYTIDTIPTYPRAGSTLCMFNCRCLLHGVRGTTSFE